jgi:hypothetical protein
MEVPEMKSIVGLRKLVWVSLALLLSLAFVAGVAFAQSKDAKPQAGAQSSKQISVVPTGSEPGGATVPPLPPTTESTSMPPLPSGSLTETVTPPASGDDPFQVTLNVDKPDSTYKIGEQIVLTFSTNKDCRLTLFNVGTSGKVHIIFPNSYQKENLVRAGVQYKVPAEGAGFALQFDGPAGEDVVKAIATLDDVAVVDPAAVIPGTGTFSQTTLSSKDIGVIGAVGPKKTEEETEGPFKKKLPKDRWTEAQQIVKVIQ